MTGVGLPQATSDPINEVYQDRYGAIGYLISKRSMFNASTISSVNSTIQILMIENRSSKKNLP